MTANISFIRWPEACCFDCATPGMASVETDTGVVLAIEHSSGCPWLAGVPEDERVVVLDAGHVVHRSADERKDPR